MTFKEWFMSHPNELVTVNGKDGFYMWCNDDIIQFDFGRYGGITKIKYKDIYQIQLSKSIWSK